MKETIPNFHNTIRRYEDLEAAIARNPRDRVKDVEREIKFVRVRRRNYGMITQALEEGRIPTRICHNDCNLNNMIGKCRLSESLLFRWHWFSSASCDLAITHISNYGNM